MKFLYLIQSEKKSHEWLKFKNKNRNFIMGVWREDPDAGQIDLRGTTMPSGRNLMYQYIVDNLLINEYDYISFCDDDVIFTLGSFEEYERVIEQSKESLYHVTYEDLDDKNGWKWHTDHSNFCRQNHIDKWHTDRIDTCFFTVKSSIMKAIFPFVTAFDSRNWWVSCEIFNIVVKNKGLVWTITPTVCVKNKSHRPYPREESSLTYGHPKVVNYLNNLLGKDYKVYEYLILK